MFVALVGEQFNWSAFSKISKHVLQRFPLSQLKSNDFNSFLLK
jgi:hypothetical protein